jgi:hypothetical protein
VNSYLEFMRDMLPRIRKAGYNAIQIMAIQVGGRSWTAPPGPLRCAAPPAPGCQPGTTPRPAAPRPASQPLCLGTPQVGAGPG